MSSTICVDIGNYSSLIATVEGRTSSAITKMRSLVYDATHNGECRNGVHPSDSPLVVVHNKSLKLGKHASHHHGHLSAAEAGKDRGDIALPLLLAATPDRFEGKVKALVPKRNENSERLIRVSIVGTHNFSVTADGKQRNAVATFSDIEFVEETKAAALFAFETGVINPVDVALCIDIGGGTVNCVVAAYENDIFSSRFYKSRAGYGGIALAQAISNTDLVKSFSRSVDISKIMDAITENKTYIGNRPDLDFAPVLDHCIEQWLDGILTRIMADADKFLDEITQIVWCGGGVEIVKDRLKQSGHLVLDNPQYANINALIHSAKSPILQIAA